MKRSRPSTGNLAALIRGVQLNIHQKAAAIAEFHKLMTYIQNLEGDANWFSQANDFWFNEFNNSHPDEVQLILKNESKMSRLVIGDDKQEV